MQERAAAPRDLTPEAPVPAAAPIEDTEGLRRQLAETARLVQERDQELDRQRAERAQLQNLVDTLEERAATPLAKALVQMASAPVIDGHDELRRQLTEATCAV